jgi:hypothetical protein
MTFAELRSAGVTLVSHCPYTREWMTEAARYGIRGMPYISLYKVYDALAPGAERSHPFWGAVDMTNHPEWVYIGSDGQRKRPFGNEFYSPMYWQSCTNTAGVADAYAKGAAKVMEQGAGGVFIDNVLPAPTCYGPQFGLHQHLYPGLNNIESFKIALQRVADTVHSFGSGRVVMLNIGNPFERWTQYGNAIMIESFIYNVAVRPGPGGWVGKERVQVKKWPEILQWIERTAPYVDRGGSIVALEYLPDDPKAAFFSFAVDKLANFLWTGESPVRRDICRTLYRCRLQRASGPLRATEGVYWRHYPNGMVALNPTAKFASVSIDAPPGLSALADAATDEVRVVREGQVRVTLQPGEGGVYVAPKALAEGHLREALVAAETALERYTPNVGVPKPAVLVAAINAITRAYADMGRASEPAAARGSVTDALRAVGTCLAGDAKADLTARLAAGAPLTRTAVVALIAPPDAPTPAVSTTGNALTIRVGGVDWTIGDDVGLVSTRGMGFKLGLTVNGLSETHGWLNPRKVITAEVVVDEPKRKVMRATLNFQGAKTGKIIEGIVLELQVESQAGDPMLTVTAAIRNRRETTLPIYFNVSSAGAGTWFASSGKPAQAGGDYLQIPHSEWTFVAPSKQGGSGLLVISDQPQSYSRYALHLYSEPRSGTLAPGESRSISFRLAPVVGSGQADPTVDGLLTRSQFYLTRAWSLAVAGRGLPGLDKGEDRVAGLPQLVRLDSSTAARSGVDLSLEGVILLDANGTSLVPAEIFFADGRYRLTARPSLQNDLFYQVVGRVRYTPENLPLAIASDFRPGPCIEMEPLGKATWNGTRGVVQWTAENRLDSELTCRLAVSVPKGYQIKTNETLTIAPGKSATVRVEIAAPAVTAPPAEVTVTLTLRDFSAAGSLSRTTTFHQ